MIDGCLSSGIDSESEQRLLSSGHTSVVVKYAEDGNLESAEGTLRHAVELLENAAPRHVQLAATLDEYARVFAK